MHMKMDFWLNCIELTKDRLNMEWHSSLSKSIKLHILSPNRECKLWNFEQNNSIDCFWNTYVLYHILMAWYRMDLHKFVYMRFEYNVNWIMWVDWPLASINLLVLMVLRYFLTSIDGKFLFYFSYKYILSLHRFCKENAILHDT